VQEQVEPRPGGGSLSVTTRRAAGGGGAGGVEVVVTGPDEPVRLLLPAGTDVPVTRA
jgi:hypothetical protein